MDRAYPTLRKMFTDIRNLWFEKMGRELRNFSIELSDFLYDLTNHPTNGWHDRFHTLTAEQRFQGRYMTPESEEALLDYISHWAAMQVASEHAVEMPEVTLDSDAFELTESERARAREGLPWWYAKPFEWGDGEWEEKFTELASVAREKLLATCRELQTLGSLARNADQLPEDGIDALEPHIARVHAAHDEYVQALIDIERTWLAYIKGHWYVGWQVEQLMLKIAGDLPPRLFDLPSPKLPLLAQARAEVGHALDKVVNRVNTTYTVAVWTDRTITVLEFATGVGGVAKAALKREIAKGVAKKIAIKIAVKEGIKQAAVQGAVLVGSMYAIPRLLAYAGLHPDFVFAGVVVLQGLTAIQGLRSVGKGKDLDLPETTARDAETRLEADQPAGVDTVKARPSDPDVEISGPQYLEPLGPGIGRSNFQTLDEFRDEVFDRYQRFYNEAHAVVMKQVDLGLVRNNQTTIGTEIDKFVRQSMRDWLVHGENLIEGPTGFVAVNRRLYDPAGTGKYRQPDIYIPAAKLILDGTVQRKTVGMRQIVEFREFSGGANVVIVRPAAEGGSYGFFFK